MDRPPLHDGYLCGLMAKPNESKCRCAFYDPAGPRMTPEQRKKKENAAYAGEFFGVFAGGVGGYYLYVLVFLLICTPLFLLIYFFNRH